jgi:hypothetical protein
VSLRVYIDFHVIQVVQSCPESFRTVNTRVVIVIIIIIKIYCLHEKHSEIHLRMLPNAVTNRLPIWEQQRVMHAHPTL